MRISEAARRLGMSPRMLRYREDLGLLPPVRGAGRGRADGHGPRHRQFSDGDLGAVTAALRLERRYQISPASLAFGLRVLSEPAVRAAVADLSRRIGRIPEPPGRALDFEKERALRLLAAPSPVIVGRESRIGAEAAHDPRERP
ncbi:MAG TPA: MerR family transcriptional regulator [Streptosporangiaceae bacterium]|nr:MerR family transcriptional regulator [Streptosporangiaceae bacterium]